MTNWARLLIAMVPLIVIAVIITLWNGYANKRDELSIAEMQKEQLQQLVTNEKQEINKLLQEVQRIQIMLDEREQKLKEVQADVYKHFQVLEKLGKKDPVIHDLLNQPIPSELWEAIRDPAKYMDKMCKDGNSTDITATISRTRTKEPNSKRVGGANSNFASHEQMAQPRQTRHQKIAGGI